MLTPALNGIASLFQVSPVPGARARWELPGLALLVAIGTLLRFWGLGSVGLHGDEETMAMPVMGIVEQGIPEFPSGMFYARAIGQLYLMAGSVQWFGESEWAFRMPSAVCGVLLIALAWWVGRRFLSPVWNMALAAVVAFLPDFIVVAQTARMYVFLVASLAAFAGFVFAWERSGRMAALLAAVVMFLIAVQFHLLAVFGIFLFLFPGLLRGDPRRIALGIGAMVLALAIFGIFQTWTETSYPDSMSALVADEEPDLLESRGGFFRALASGVLPIALGVLLSAGLVVYTVRPISRQWPKIAAGTLLLAGLACQLLMSYHLAFLLMLGGAVVALRSERVVLRRLLLFLAASAIVAAVHVSMLYSAGTTSPWKLAGALSGLPSFWTYLQLGHYSAAAMFLAWVGVGCALWRLASGARVSDVWLFFALAVWLPLLGLGVFEWYVPSRYTDFAIVPLLVCAFATAQQFWQHDASGAQRKFPVVAAAVAAIIIVNPVAFARTWDAGYALHPDHKGAAEFIRKVNPGPRDIVIAEDVLQQTYYLGHVDYWLLGRHVGLKYCEEIDGQPFDFYTHTRLIGTGEELQALVARKDRGAIYVIGSGEEQKDGRRFARGYGIFEALQSPEFREVYRGRDGLTRVWKVTAPN